MFHLCSVSLAPPLILRSTRPAQGAVCKQNTSFTMSNSIAVPVAWKEFVIRSYCRCSSHNRVDGGDRRDRTDDLKLAKLPLSQLSYVPSN